MTWRPVVGWPAYEVSDTGLIRRVRDGRVVRQSTTASGYQVVSLRDGGRKASMRVHRVILMAFVPNPNNWPQVNHIDGNKTNNALDNLEWATAEWNHKHAWMIGLRTRADLPIKYGSDHPASKLTWEIVEAARRRYRAGLSIRALAREYGVHHRTMADAILERAWRLPSPPAATTP